MGPMFSLKFQFQVGNSGQGPTQRGEGLGLTKLDHQVNITFMLLRPLHYVTRKVVFLTPSLCTCSLMSFLTSNQFHFMSLRVHMMVTKNC
jgi:hypothetical protein